MKYFGVVFCILSFTDAAPLNSTSSECSVEKIEKIGDCVKDLVSTVEKISKWVDKEYKFDDGEKKEFRDKCDETQKCFVSVKSSCPDFPEEVTNELDVMCSRFNFIIDKFAECVPKLEEMKCVNEVFGPKSLKKTSNEKCKDLKEHEKCAIEEVQTACGEKFKEIFVENFNVELNMHKC
ncbi:hypothetical protein B9Z55_020746 [Caenorhabditis nigoni]|uniref:T20D4.11-like domain-containing protein n=1 Tax=Caenorhabditis nigoni TaxID=1611254 RepID=A0A2G5TPT0_9PELO|nr:hypothetical protein B9Z55_020746 [Caenorhabditis nigoni]